LGFYFYAEKVARKRSIPNVLASYQQMSKPNRRSNAKPSGKCSHFGEAEHWRRNCTKFLALKGEGNESFYLG
jgi:hypothetical protein